jgi:hypothetical protein
MFDMERQLSDQSRFLAEKCISEKQENAARVHFLLLSISRAHRIGVLSLKNKQECKQVLLSQGCDMGMRMLSSFPGSAKVLSQKPTESTCMSRVHIMHEENSYSITMNTGDVLKFEMFLEHPPPLHSEKVLALQSHFNLIANNNGKWISTLKEPTRRLLEEGINAGGNSIHSEALSFEIMQRVFACKDLVAEMQVRYTSRHCSMLDYVCTTFKSKLKVGVSVTRAMHFMGSQYMTKLDCEQLIVKKLGGLERASRFLVEPVQIRLLHVFAQDQVVANWVQDVFLSSSTGSCLLFVTVCRPPSLLNRFVFHNEDKTQRDPLGHEKLKQELHLAESILVKRLVQKQLDQQRLIDAALKRLLKM